MAAFSEHHWKPWKFKKAPRGWWSALASAFLHNEEAAHATLREFVETTAAKQLNVNSLDDWLKWNIYTLPPYYRKKFQLFGGLQRVLAALYPNHPWPNESSSNTTSTKIITTCYGLPELTKALIASNLRPFSLQLIRTSFWRSSNIRKYLDNLKDQLGGRYEDLYKLDYAKIVSTGGR